MKSSVEQVSRHPDSTQKQWAEHVRKRRKRGVLWLVFKWVGVPLIALFVLVLLAVPLAFS